MHSSNQINIIGPSPTGQKHSPRYEAPHAPAPIRRTFRPPSANRAPSHRHENTHPGKKRPNHSPTDYPVHPPDNPTTMIYVLQESSNTHCSKQMRLVRTRDEISTHPPCTNHAVLSSLAENRVTAAAEALVTIAEAATVAAGVRASALGTGSNMLLPTDCYPSLSL